ncbi:MAG TPA: sulfite exporter TauE/SafE family protein [Kofleriaceae bacterium]|nr:sulfite exporter TauE/SafE family protein [Kofleriaceae bacterium]
MLALGLVLSALIGLALGVLGGGGSILTVPTIHYVFGLDTHAAIAASLAVVAITSLTTVIPHARAGRVRWRVGVYFGLASMAGAFTAARVARYLPGTLLLVAFGVVMMVTAVAMLRPRREAPPGTERPLRPAAIAVQGFAVGAVAGLVGAGGGFLIVPALVLLAGLPMGEACATSSLVIAMNSAAGFAGAATSGPVPGRVIAIVAITAVAGGLAGAHWAGRIPAERLRALFGKFVIAMGVLVLGQELPRAAGHPLDLTRHWPWLLGAIVLAVAAASLVRPGQPVTAGPQGRHPDLAPCHDQPPGSPDAVSPALGS